MDYVLILSITTLLILVILPFWLNAPKISRDQQMIKDVLEPEHRRYTLLIPEDYGQTQRMPLVISLHYGGHGIPYYGELMLRELIYPSLRSLRAVIAAPDCPGKDWTLAESSNFVLDLLAHLKDQYDIDPKKILITGYSLGGIGAWQMAYYHPDLFSGAIVMAAQPPEWISVGEWSVPLYVIHGREDEHFGIVNTTRMVVQLEEAGKDVTYRILERVRHYEVSKYSTPLQQTVPWILDRWE
jgi:predicted peptidase